MTHHYTATIMSMRLTDIAGNCLEALGNLSGESKRRITKNIKKDLLENILPAVVEDSIKQFYKGKNDNSPMAESLRRGISATGRTPSSIRAIISGVDYAIMHEEDATLTPSHSNYLAIPLPAACRADGRPRFSSPRGWRNYHTFVLSGNYVTKARIRKPKPSEINPHGTDEVAYIVYKDKRYKRKKDGLVFLYKLVPYSIFKEGKRNAYGEPLRKLGLSRRFLYYVSTAWKGWAEMVAYELSTTHDMSAVEVYKGAYASIVSEKYQSTFERIYGKTTAKTKAEQKLAGFVSDIDKIIRS